MKLTLAIVAVAAFALTACESRDESRVRIEKQLPHGCHLVDLGQYGPIRALVMVACEDMNTTTVAEWTEPCGKAQCSHSSSVYTPAGRAALQEVQE